MTEDIYKLTIMVFAIFGAFCVFEALADIVEKLLTKWRKL